MDEATALRQCRKLWKGSGLRVTACRAPAPPAQEAAADAATDAGAQPTTPRRRSLADFEAAAAGGAGCSTDPPPPPPSASSQSPPPLSSSPPPKALAKPPPRRPDIGLSLGIGRCTEGAHGVVPLGKAHAKRPIGETAVVPKAEAEAARLRALEARANEEQVLEAQRLQRALELENAKNHPMLMRRALDAWRSQRQEVVA